MEGKHSKEACIGSTNRKVHGYEDFNVLPPHSREEIADGEDGVRKMNNDAMTNDQLHCFPMFIDHLMIDDFVQIEMSFAKPKN